MNLHSDSGFPPHIPQHVYLRRAVTAPDFPIKKLASDPTPNKSLKHDRIDGILKNELEGAIFLNPGLVDFLFPDSALSMRPEEVLSYIKNNRADPGDKLLFEDKWNLKVFLPDDFSTKDKEVGCARLFNAVGALSALAANVPL